VDIRGQLTALARALPHALRRARRQGPPRVRFVYNDLGAPTRYRVHHQVEQAALVGLEAEAVPLEDLDRLYDLGACDLLYLYRLPLTSHTWPLLAAARLLGIPALFDSDDLVWDPAERRYNYLDDHYSPRVVAAILKGARRTAALMRRVDAFVFSTPYLAQLARRRFRQPIFVNENALSSAMLAAGAEAYARRPPPTEQVVIGYFCGTPHVHDEDLAGIAPALRAVLDRHPAVCLRFYGELRLPAALDAPSYAGRVERRPAVPWHELLAHIAQVDVNIAPLVDNPQRRAKSAVKYLEAALVGVPGVAANLDPYRHTLAPGSTGFLAGSTREWIASLSLLVRSPDLRRRMGNLARAHVLAAHTTDYRAPNFAAIINRVLASTQSEKETQMSPRTGGSRDAPIPPVSKQ
jgi:glycosyltransferase involved in cell wall biosynthesis